MRFNSKISVIEERTDLDTMTMDELHGTLTTYEMRTEEEDSLGKEATFKAFNKRGTSKPKPKSKDSNDDESDNKEEANFVRNLKRGTCKDEGKLPLKCFECGKIGHFASKCPYAKDQNSDYENSYQKNKSSQKYKKANNGRSAKSRNLYSKEKNNSSDDDSDSDNDFKKVLFLAMHAKEVTIDHDESEEEGEVNLEAKMINVLKQLCKARKESKLLNKELGEVKEITQDIITPGEMRKAFMDLRADLEEAKVTEESLREQLEENEGTQEELERKIVSLRRSLDNENIKQKYDKSIETLNQIINSQRSIQDKSGLGYCK